MEKKKQVKNFWDFYLDPEKEDKESAIEFLKKAGINVEEEKRKLVSYLDKKKAEISIQRGKEFKEEYISMEKEENPDDVFAEGMEVQLAYRNSDRKDNADEDVLKEDMKKMNIIKKIKDKDEKDDVGKE